MQLDFNTPPNTPILPAAPARACRPWVRLAPTPPGITFADLGLLHRSQIHAAVAKKIGGRKGGNFAASVLVDLGLDPNRQHASQYLIVASTRCRAPGGWCDRLDLAALPCNDQMAAYYATPADPELARWAFDQYAAGATYKVVLNKWGGLDSFHPWGVDWSCHRS